MLSQKSLPSLSSGLLIITLDQNISLVLLLMGKSVFWLTCKFLDWSKFLLHVENDNNYYFYCKTKIMGFSCSSPYAGSLVRFYLCVNRIQSCCIFTENYSCIHKAGSGLSLGNPPTPITPRELGSNTEIPQTSQPHYRTKSHSKIFSVEEK